MPRNVVDQLNLEWQGLVHSPCTTRSVAEWASRCTSLRTCRQLSELPAAIRSNPDEVLGFLIGRYQNGDDLAGRAVLQSMLGKLVRMAYTGLAKTQHDALSDLVAHMWCRVATYPLAARPSSVAANLVLDTLKASQRNWQTTEVPTTPARLEDLLEAAEHQTNPITAEDLIQTALQLGLITHETHQVMTSVYGPQQLTGAEAAQTWACSPAAIRSRCKFGTDRMHRAANMLVTAA